MAFRTLRLFFAGLLLLQPFFLTAQQQRPAVMPLSQGGGGPKSADSGSSFGGLTDGPIQPGEIVHINVFDAPDFSLTTRVSESGDIPVPILGSFHIAGLNSASASQKLAQELKDSNLMLD